MNAANQTERDSRRSARSCLGSLLAATVGGVMFVYLLNPTLGIDLIPDYLPLGNLDEAAATAILIACLSYFGVDLTWLTRRAGPRRIAETSSEADNQ